VVSTPSSTPTCVKDANVPLFYLQGATIKVEQNENTLGIAPPKRTLSWASTEVQPKQCGIPAGLTVVQKTR
jgi:hypothetical protein